jgi:hypothetical protein
MKADLEIIEEQTSKHGSSVHDDDSSFMSPKFSKMQQTDK